MPDETMQGNTHYRLARLDDLDGYQVADGEPDPRGWDVRAADGRTIGRVDSLIADTGAMKVRYLDVALDKDALNLSEDRHVLIPIGGAALAETEDVVGLPSLQSSRVAQLPAYRHTEISREDEHRVMGQFDGRYIAAPYADFYSHQHFSDRAFFGTRRRRKEGAAYLTRSEEELAVGKRRVKAGEVGVRKRVETERVKKAVPVARDEVEADLRKEQVDIETKGAAQIDDRR